MELRFISPISGMSSHNTVKPPQSAFNLNRTTEPTTDEEVSPNINGSSSVAVADESKISRLQVGDKALEELVNNLNQHVQSTSRELHFSIDKKYGRPIVSVIDKETNRVIRQIPTEIALQVADTIDEAAGALISERA